MPHRSSPSSRGPRSRRRVVVMAVLGVTALLLLLGLPPAWEYSNSVGFCGTTCHTMPPEYNTYQLSPHARVPCVDCHIGRGLIIEQFARKSGHMRLLWATATGDYEYPIRSHSMRPARDTCELCHFPEKFSDDSLRVLQHFEEDEANSPFQTYLLMHTGGGSQREGLGRGIHWHVENVVEYVATDALEQEIPWVRVQTPDGATREYRAEGVEGVPEGTLHRMDCMTCHNRISHLVDHPRDLVEKALARGTLSSAVPFIRREALAALESAGHDEPFDAGAFRQRYAEGWPEFTAAHGPALDEAVGVLETMFAENTFPDQELDWRTHPDNIGHRDWPGCFRCHDGRHFDDTGDAIRLECNLCHSIPLVVRPEDVEPMLPVATGHEPASHLETTWISRHHNMVDPSCAACHTVENAGGTSDRSFCSNSQCHGVGWKYGGFDAPALAWDLGIQQEEAPAPAAAPAVSGSFGEVQQALSRSCGACHGPRLARMGLKLTDHDGLMAGSDRGPVVVPKNPAGSRLVQVLEAGHFANLPAADLERLRAWIAAGARAGGKRTTATGFPAVQEALRAACGTCHGRKVQNSGLGVTDYDSLMAGGDGGPVVVPGDPAASRIVKVLASGHYARLSAEALDRLERWIAAGASAGGVSGPPEAAADAQAAPDLYDPHATTETTAEGLPCVTCHEPEAAAVGTDHDAAVVAVGDEDQTCLSCHDPTNDDAPYRMDAVAGMNPASGRCLACHDGTRARATGAWDHPGGLHLTTAGLPFSTPGYRPYQAPDGTPAADDAVGEITCTTCHDPHRWRHGATSRPGAAEGSERDSFLRDPRQVSRYCSVCHGVDGLVRFYDFHAPRNGSAADGGAR